jgi:hypothetical protein
LRVLRSYLSYCLKQYAHVGGGCNGISFVNLTTDLAGFDDGMVIGPGYLEAMGQQLYRWRTFRTQDQKSRCCRAKAAHHPKNIFHCLAPSLFDSDSLVDAIRFDGLDAVNGGGCLFGFRRVSQAGEERLHFLAWIGSSSVVHLVSGLVRRLKRW